MSVILTASCQLQGVVGFISLFLESSVSFPFMLLQWQNVSTVKMFTFLIKYSHSNCLVIFKLYMANRVQND